MKILKRKSDDKPFRFVPVPEHVDVADLIDENGKVMLPVLKYNSWDDLVKIIDKVEKNDGFECLTRDEFRFFVRWECESHDSESHAQRVWEAVNRGLISDPTVVPDDIITYELIDGELRRWINDIMS